MIKKCIGCGYYLQDKDKNGLGYVPDINRELCERCFRLKNYGNYQSVTLNNIDYKKIINNIPTTSLVVYVVSLLNFNLDFINDFNNYMIVLTKKDLLPKTVKDEKLLKYVKNKVNNCLDIEIVSANKNCSIDKLYNKIKEYGKNKDIYFVGMTNSGKSTLINTFIKNYTNETPKITTSIYPSTTLNKINITIGDLKIIDTPGLLNTKSILNYLPLNEIKKITPKRELKPRSYQIKGSAKLLIENYLQINIQGSDNIVFFISNNLNIKRITRDNESLKNKYKHNLVLNSNNDIVIDDLCFIKFQKAIQVEVYTLHDINVTLRNNLI